MSRIDATSQVMALRAQILERNAALSRAAGVQPAVTPSTITPPAVDKPAEGGFGARLDAMLKDVNTAQNQAMRSSEAYERGDNVDVAEVMLARQKASIGFEATLQVRNKLLSAYKDIMSMPV